MKVLLVEDNPTMLSKLQQAFREFSRPVVLTVARSRDVALEQLSSASFDVAVLDLSIPTADDQLDEAIDHGLYVLERMRSDHQGTPLLAFTAYNTKELLMQSFLPHQINRDVYGGGERNMLKMYEKLELGSLVAELESISAEVQALSDIELIGDEPRDAIVNRIISVFCRQSGATRAKLKRFTAGNSSASVWQVELLTAGEVSLRALAKIGKLSNLHQEEERYKNAVALPAGLTPALVGLVRCGTRDFGGLFFQLVDDTLGSLFEVIKSDQALAEQSIGRLADAWQIWAKRPETRTTISQLRSLVLPDVSFERVILDHSLEDLRSLESRNIDARLCVQHRDFHGENVLVMQDGKPIMIDLLTIGSASSAFDPVTLELSLIFHPHSPFYKQWPPVESVALWANVDVYTASCPYAGVVKACRAWAKRYATAHREIHAAVYAYVIWQLKFTSADVPLAKEFLSMVQAFFDTQ